jgi:hypothetical protein
MEGIARHKLLKKSGFLQSSRQTIKLQGSLVPDEGIEPPTFGLQNRCSTAELIRPFMGRGE